MNPYSSLGIDQQTAGYLGSAGINPVTTQAPYPTYPNGAGVGSQTAGQPSQNPTTSTSGSGVVTPNKTESPDVSLRGMTPYSLIGDANYREK